MAVVLMVFDGSVGKQQGLSLGGPSCGTVPDRCLITGYRKQRHNFVVRHRRDRHEPRHERLFDEILTGRILAESHEPGKFQQPLDAMHESIVGTFRRDALG